MTGLHAGSDQCSRMARDPDCPSLSGLRVVWSLGRRAVVAALQGAEGATAVDAHAAPYELVVELPGPGGQVNGVAARVTLRDPSGADRDLDPIHGQTEWVLDESQGIAHVDIAGELRVTFELEPGLGKPLYAVSSVPERLGLLGGRYRVDRVETVFN